MASGGAHFAWLTRAISGMVGRAKPPSQRQFRAIGGAQVCRGE